MTLQFFCDWLWAPLIAPGITYCVGRILSATKFGRKILRRLTLGNPKIAIIADSAERHNISKSLTSTSVFKSKNITCKTYKDTGSKDFDERFDVVVIVFDYKEDDSNKRDAEAKLNKFCDSFKSNEEPIVIFAKKKMNRALFNDLRDRPNTSICEARGRLTADIIAQLTAFNA
mgnify:CR=1 FL=1